MTRTRSSRKLPPPSLADVADDVLAVVGRVCSSPLAPSSLVQLSATCRHAQTVLRPVVEELQALNAAVRVLCTKIGMRPADLGKATELDAQFKGLDYADVAVLVTLANSGSLLGLTCLELDDNQIGDAEMVGFSRAIASGSLRALTGLWLGDNQIGDTGMIEFSRSIAIDPLAIALENAIMPWSPILFLLSQRRVSAPIDPPALIP